MAQVSWWGAEFERIASGGLASSTEDRLTRLRKCGGSMRKRTERMSLHEWPAALEAELRRRAASGAGSRAALDRLLED